jgi:murein DD-endopeptidase MepM/ murein hydrolase activator NlpD
MIPALIACFYAGGVAGWLLHATFAPDPVSFIARPAAGDREDPVATSGGRETRRTPDATGDAPTIGSDPIAELRRRDLDVPVEGAEITALEGDFAERRGGRQHEAVDILAPRNTPVRAVEDGTIAKLFFSKAGGTTIYQFDPAGRFCYYYAHLEQYAAGLREGQKVSRGEVIGYVGTSGNAPPNTPHLHFAVFELTDARRWWEGRPLDPYLVFRK